MVVRRLYGKATKNQRRSRPKQLRVVRACAAMIEVLSSWTGRWRRSEDGVAAVEFAMFAPILFFALGASVDVGMAEYERMTIDHILRAGAQSAMVNPGVDQVQKVLENTASKNFTLSTQMPARADALYVSAEPPFCACPDNTSVKVACSTTCTDSTPTFIYYRMSGAKIYNGMIMPAMTLSPSVQVQVR